MPTPEQMKHRPLFAMATPDLDVQRMMVANGYTLGNIKDAHFVVFPGGADINPFLYGQRRNPKTHVSFLRDLNEIGVLRQCTDKQVKIGICRGAQFLNVMVGNGSLFQHVDNHTRFHKAFEPYTQAKHAFTVSSTHHQMMIPGPSGIITLAAKEAAVLETDTQVFSPEKIKETPTMISGEHHDPECIIYVDEKAFCVQFHPEYNSKDNKEAQEWFFNELSTYFLTNEQERERARLTKMRQMN